MGGGGGGTMVLPPTAKKTIDFPSPGEKITVFRGIDLWDGRRGMFDALIASRRFTNQGWEDLEFKGIVSRDFRGLQIIWMEKTLVLPDIDPIYMS